MPREEGSDLPPGLRYSSDSEPGYSRRRAGKGFSYRDLRGRRISDREELRRIKELVIPPAYQRVWICPFAEGHLQATGFDDRGRKQYRYHPLFQEYQNSCKFQRMEGFARRLPRIREAVRSGLRHRGLDREKVLATAVFLLDITGIRVGNRRYAISNESYGLTTLRTDHVEVEKSEVRFQFIGKSGKERRLSVRHPTVAKVLRNCQELPGEQLLMYGDGDGQLHRVCSHDVNAYLREISGAEIFAKDFRTWVGSLAAFDFLLKAAAAEEKPLKKTTVSAIKHAAAVLGNTPATCRKYYVHPAILQAYEQGSILRHRPRNEAAERPGLYPEELKPIEKALLQLISRSRRMHQAA